jgi:nicotinamide N-methyltransferase
MEEENEILFRIENLPNSNIILQTAENDFNKNKRSLFATMIWHGAKVLSEYLSSKDKTIFIKDKCVIEFGAAAGLPSIVCNHIGAKVVCASDYPAQLVLDTLQINIEKNKQTDLTRSIGCISHIWGENVETLLEFNNNNLYDVAIAAECLWHHESHFLFLQSIHSVLISGGHLIVSYSHHIPGLEAADDNFFEVAKAVGFSTISTQTFSAPHMWNDQKTSLIYVCELVKQ